MAGTQESVLNDKLGAYKTAKDRLNAAEHAPNSATAQTELRDAQTAYSRARGSVQTAYDAYERSMTSAGHTPKSLQDFASGARTSW
jgi:molybdopterin-biosynthesis enzyme MoeA-like protein